MSRVSSTWLTHKQNVSLIEKRSTAKLVVSCRVMRACSWCISVRTSAGLELVWSTVIQHWGLPAIKHKIETGAKIPVTDGDLFAFFEVRVCLWMVVFEDESKFKRKASSWPAAKVRIYCAQCNDCTSNIKAVGSVASVRSLYSMFQDALLPI